MTWEKVEDMMPTLGIEYMSSYSKVELRIHRLRDANKTENGEVAGED